MSRRIHSPKKHKLQTMRCAMSRSNSLLIIADIEKNVLPKVIEFRERGARRSASRKRNSRHKGQRGGKFSVSFEKVEKSSAAGARGEGHDRHGEGSRRLPAREELTPAVSSTNIYQG